MNRTSLGFGLLALVIGAAALATSGCDVNGYCINCANGDGGFGDDGGDGDGGATPDAPVIDAGDGSDACVTSGIEVCDDMDNDCDGMVDEGQLDGVGVVCSTNMGECQEGITVCSGGMISCGGNAILPVPEVCDNLDNDCDGTADNGDPEGGGVCGSSLGDCQQGINRCMNGGIVCFGEMTGGPEVCDTRDNDCDGMFDENIPNGGTCGPTQGNVGECQEGILQCIGGVMQCVNARYPTLEQCDALDRDCDGNPTNGFDLMNDARNCGACGNNCTDDFAPGDHVSAVRCNMGTCQIAACEADYYNNDMLYGTGCEDFCDTFIGTQELCNGLDDNCNGTVDEGVAAPQSCDINGMNCHDICDIAGTPCGGTFATCAGAGGWVCNWPGTVETDMSGNLIQESRCDGIDNDCDGVSDETFPQKGGTCFDNGQGICQRSGTWACNSTNDALECGNLSPPVSPSVESCNGLDDDCMGDIDEGFTNGANQAWVDLGGGVQIFAYEASRPDANSMSAGAISTHACSKPDALPWTTITQPAAEAMCTAMGARLCTETEWEMACTSSRQGAGPDFLVTLEAEEYANKTTGSTGGTTFSWVKQARTGASGDVMYSFPDTNQNFGNNTGPRMDYSVSFTQTGTHYVWVHVYEITNGDDRLHVGLNGIIPAGGNTVGQFGGGWTWHSTLAGGGRATINVPTVGVHTFNVFMRDENVTVDKIVITTSSTYTPPGLGPAGMCIWGYGANCRTNQPDACNGDDYDTTPGGADQDAILPTRSLSSCYADWGSASQRVYDMSGNVKEWTAERAPNQNPMRGGASNNTATGISCRANFGLGNDSFAFPNVGFRCCR